MDEHQIDWNLLRSFLAVVAAGSLTRAAEKLSTSQPTLSRQIAALETAVGAPLFERAARRLIPTNAGLALVEPAQRMQEAMLAAKSVVRARTAKVSGVVRLTASDVVSAYVLPEILAELARRHPEIEIELVASNRIDNLLERQADIAIRMIRPTQRTLIARRIGDWPLGLHAHKDYLASVGGRVEAVSARGYRWIGQDHDLDYIQAFRAAGFDIDKTFFGFRCDNQIVMIRAVCAGLGIGVVFMPLARRLGLVPVLPDLPRPSLPVWLTAHRELKSSERLRRVFDFLTKALTEWSSDGHRAASVARRPRS